VRDEERGREERERRKGGVGEMEGGREGWRRGVLLTGNKICLL
jgi:hypothetical protein